jgi:hypothetical protein
MVSKRALPRRGIGRRGQSAVFDAFLFFIILTSASILSYIVPSTIAKQNEQLLSSQYRNELADNTLKAVLKSTINATSFVKNGDTHDIYDVDVMSAIAVYMELKYETKKGMVCDLSDLQDDIEHEFEISVPGEYRYSLESTYSRDSSAISDIIAGEEAPKTTRSSSFFEADDGESVLTIIFSIWT